VGGRFWIGLVAGLVGVGIAVIVGFAVFGAALAAWGFLGAMLFLFAVLIMFGWIHDRRHAAP
jgi:hypothetical protein